MRVPPVVLVVYTCLLLMLNGVAGFLFFTTFEYCCIPADCDPGLLPRDELRMPVSRDSGYICHYPDYMNDKMGCPDGWWGLLPDDVVDDDTYRSMCWAGSFPYFGTLGVFAGNFILLALMWIRKDKCVLARGGDEPGRTTVKLVLVASSTLSLLLFALIIGYVAIPYKTTKNGVKTSKFGDQDAQAFSMFTNMPGSFSWITFNFIAVAAVPAAYCIVEFRMLEVWRRLLGGVRPKSMSANDGRTPVLLSSSGFCGDHTAKNDDTQPIHARASELL